MRRLARWGFNILSALSLLLLAVVVTGWVRSYGEGDCFVHGSYFPTRVRYSIVGSFGGRIGCVDTHVVFTGPNGASNFTSSRQAYAKSFPPGWHRLDAEIWRRWEPQDQSFWHRRGFRFEEHGMPHDIMYASTPYAWRYRFLAVPYWLAAALSCVLPVVQGVSLMRWMAGRRRVRRGLCPKCGYDLRATPERCPECGRERVCHR